LATTGPGLMDHRGGDLAVGGVSRGHVHGSDQLAAWLFDHMELVAVEPLVRGLAAVAHVGITEADDAVWGDFPLDLGTAAVGRGAVDVLVDETAERPPGPCGQARPRPAT
jgi:hypothetical protein